MRNLSDEYTKYTTVPAYIIDRDWENLNSTIVINVGKKRRRRSKYASSLSRWCCWLCYI